MEGICCQWKETNSCKRVIFVVGSKDKYPPLRAGQPVEDEEDLDWDFVIDAVEYRLYVH
jgi:hypothetical protein